MAPEIFILLSANKSTHSSNKPIISAPIPKRFFLPQQGSHSTRSLLRSVCGDGYRANGICSVMFSVHWLAFQHRWRLFEQLVVNWVLRWKLPKTLQSAATKLFFIQSLVAAYCRLFGQLQLVVSRYVGPFLVHRCSKEVQSRAPTNGARTLCEKVQAGVMRKSANGRYAKKCKDVSSHMPDVSSHRALREKVQQMVISAFLNF